MYYDAVMGQRAGHETFIAIIGAFVKQKRWTQAALGRAIGVGTDAFERHEVRADRRRRGFEEQSREPSRLLRPHVYVGLSDERSCDKPCRKCSYDRGW